MKFKLKKSIVCGDTVIEAYQGYDEWADTYSDSGSYYETELTFYKLMITPLDRRGAHVKYDMNKESFTILSADKEILNRIAYTHKHAGVDIKMLNRVFGRGTEIVDGWLWNLGGEVKQV